MKLKKYSWLAALPMIFTACQDDTLVENPQQDQMVYTLSAQVDKGAANSRAQIQLGNPQSGEEFFFWNKGDAFAIYQQQGENDFQQSIFTIADDYQEPVQGSLVAAEFSTTTPVYASLDYVAAYPENVEKNWDELHFYLQPYVNFNDKTQAEAWKDYFQKNMFMLATGNFEDAENASVSFQHLCAMARVTYINKSGEPQTLSQFYMDPQQEVGLCYRYNLKEGWGDFVSTAYRYWLDIEGLTVADGEAVDLYMMFFPMAFNDSQLTLAINANNSEKYSYIDMSTIAAANPGDSTFVAGKRYWFKLTDTGEELMWTKDYKEEDFIGTDTIYNRELSFALYEELGSEMVSLVDGYAVMKRKDIRSVTNLDFGRYKYTITSLAGIEHFINLENLDCNYTQLAECDLSQNKKLKSVVICGSLLTTLDLSGLTELEYVGCPYSDTLSELIICDSPKLGHLECMGTQLEAINFANPDAVWQLICGGNPNLKLDLNLYPNMTTLGIHEYPFKEEDIPASIHDKLTYLTLEYNGLTSIDLSKYPNLEVLGVLGNELTELVIPQESKLTHLFCHYNKISTLDITPLADTLKELHCGDQDIDSDMVLTLTQDQKNKWDSVWFEEWGNNNVTFNVVNAQ